MFKNELLKVILGKQNVSTPNRNISSNILLFAFLFMFTWRLRPIFRLFSGGLTLNPVGLLFTISSNDSTLATQTLAIKS